jgi:O-antigen/teichoic acid export membrane protein
MMLLLRSASFWAVLSTALRLGGGILTLPIALRSLSQDELGLYYTFVGISSLALLLDFGFAATIIRNASYAVGGAKSFKCKGMPELHEAGGVNWVLLDQLRLASQRWYLIVSVVLAFLLFVGGGGFIYRQLEAAQLGHSYLFCWFLFAVSSTIGFATSYWQDLLMGIGQVAVSARIGMITQAVNLGLLVVLLLSGWGLWSYAVSSLVSIAVGRVLCVVEYRRHVDMPNHDMTENSTTEILKTLWPMAWRQGVVALGAYLIVRGNTLVCTETLGLSETGKYGLTLNILTIVFQVVSTPLMMAWPAIGNLRVKDDVISIRKIFFLRAYGGLISAMIGLLVIANYGSIMLTWIGAKTTFIPFWPFLIFALVMWMETHHSMYAGLVLSENQNPFIAQAIISGLLIFLLSWWTAPRWGLLGLIATQGLVQLLWNNWWTVWRGLKSLHLIAHART